VRLREAPLVTRHHLDPPDQIYMTSFPGDPDSTSFVDDLKAALSASHVRKPLADLGTDDQWVQDYFETAYMAMPAVGGMHVIHVDVRSANQNRNGPSADYPLREAGQVVFTELRGKDVAGVQQFTSHPASMDTLDSFGNLETVPPYSWGGKSYPLGRIFRGNVPSWHPDTSMLTLFESQKVQPPLYVDTSFLLVGHVDETISFLKAPTERGWTIAVADPALARSLLLDQQAAGNGGALVFAGQYWSSGMSSVPAQRTIDDLLADTDIQGASATAAAGIDAQIAVLEQETGLADAEILHLPVLFQSSGGRDVAYMVGTVNGISLGDADFGAPRPHGPVIGGRDIFEVQMEAELARVGVSVHWIEDWNLYHALDGEVHCGSNTRRQIPATERWWESGL
jgi:protein-arginine deiminase